MQYHIFFHKTHGYYAVKVGWSWVGFFFPFIWMVVKGLWQEIALFLIGGFVAGILYAAIGTGQLAGTFFLSANIISMITLGYLGNEWKANNLRRRDYEHITTVAAQTAQAALWTFSQKQQHRQTDSIKPEPSHAGNDEGESLSQADMLAQLEKMHALKERGALTEDEFIEQKERILNQQK